jgi:hypothetical protein
MGWEINGDFYVEAGRTVPVAFVDLPWALEFFLARPTTSGVKLTTGPTSITLDRGVVVGSTFQGEYTYYAEVTNQSDRGAWFKVFGSTLS